MAGALHCPGCGATFVAAVADGKTVRCRDCARPFRVSHIGRFQVLSELGRGGFGVVYRVYDPRMDREAALKMLQREVLGGDKAEVNLKRFRNETKALARIVHPNIVPLYEAGEQNGCPYIVTALIDGKPLDALMPTDGFLEVPRAVRIVGTLLEALHHVHAKYGLSHRDVKPSNVMVGDGDAVYLMDFGLVFRHDQTSTRLTTEGSALGTPSYMSPEQVLGVPDRVGPWSDQYCAGVVLFQLLTGRLPFEAPFPQIYKDIVWTPPPDPHALRPALDPDLSRIVLRALEKEPPKRYADCHEFAEALNRWSAGVRSALPPAAPTRRRWVYVVGGALVLAGVAVGGVLLA